MPMKIKDTQKQGANWILNEYVHFANLISLVAVFARFPTNCKLKKSYDKNWIVCEKKYARGIKVEGTLETDIIDFSLVGGF